MKQTEFQKRLFSHKIWLQQRMLRVMTAIVFSTLVLTGANTPITQFKAQRETDSLKNASRELLLKGALNSFELTGTNRDKAIRKSDTTSGVEIVSPSLTTQVRKSVLKNGLTILTKEVHTVPVVSVQVWYRVGFRDRAPGEKGVAHLVEHLMFRGTQNRPIAFGRLLAALGSDFNASVTPEFTYYFNTAESNKLKALLTLEADRMHNASLKADEIAKEKQVIISELQGKENSPYLRLYRAVMQAAFPNRSYGLTDTQADIEQITVEQVRNFYRKNYRPDNAFLVIVGDFQTETTLREIREIFGKIPRGKGITSREEIKARPTFPDTATTFRRPIVVRESGGVPLLAMVYPFPARNHPDLPALAVMDYILTYGITSYLHQTLVGSGLATNVEGRATSLSDGGWYLLGVSANSAQKLEAIEGALEQVIKSLHRNGVTAEQVSRAKRQIQGATVLTYRDFHSQASQLGYDQTTVDNYRHTDLFLEAVAKVSAADVQRVAKKYLKSTNRTVGLFKPTQIGNTRSRSLSANFSQTTENFRPRQPFSVAEVAKYLPKFPAQVPKRQQAIPQQFTLSNGLKVLLLPDSNTPSVSLRGYLRTGQEFEPQEKAGLAALTAINLPSEPFQLAYEFESRGGAALKFEPDRKGVNIYGVSLTADLPFLLEMLADILQYPVFPTQSLELNRQSYLTALKASANNPAHIAQRLFVKAIFPENHPFSQVPTEETLRTIRREDLIEFYQTYYRPKTTVLAMVGNFNPSQVRAQLEALLGGWQATGKPKLSRSRWPAVSPPQKVVRLQKRLPGQTQSLTIMGYPIPNWTESRFYPARVLNEILGGEPLSSRLVNEIRHRQGLTYTIGSSLETQFNIGLLLIGMQTAPENTAKAIAGTLDVLKQLREKGVTDSEVEIAKQSLISKYRLALTNPDILASIILNNQVSGYNPQELHQVPSKIQAVTSNQVNQMAKELLHPDRIVVVTVSAQP